MYAIVGLGNPGATYAHTRHNVGFDIVALLAERYHCTFHKEREQAKIAECYMDGKKVLLIQPQTYMNLSGIAVAGILRYYKIPLDNVLIIYDDIDIAPGWLRLRPSGGAGTHNGMRSIVGELQSEAFARLRVGIGGRNPHYSLADWVLSRYETPEEKENAQLAYQKAGDAVVAYVQQGIAYAMSHYNTKKPKQPKQPIKEQVDE